MKNYSRFDPIDVEVREVELDVLLVISVEEVIALRIPWIESRIIGTSKRSVARFTAVIYKQTRSGRILSSGSNPKI